MNYNFHYTTPISKIELEHCQKLIELAITEDAPKGDMTSSFLFDLQEQGEASIFSNSTGILSGLDIITYILDIDFKLNHTNYNKNSFFQPLNFVLHCEEGQSLIPREKIVTFKGPLQILFRLERVVLNFLQYLSGISTRVNELVEIAGPHVYILDTRKTIPGYRYLAKYAVYVGGGVNHRINLSDMILIKDNHIASKGGVKEVLKTIKEKNYLGLKVEVEVENLIEFEEALEFEPDYILLDNMNNIEIFKALEFLKVFEKKYVSQGKNIPTIELSGNWDQERLHTFDKMKLSRKIGISMGALTHQTHFLDMSMEYKN